MIIITTAVLAACWLAVQASTLTDAAHDTGSVSTPPEYVIGADDRLTITFWREPVLSTDVVVRPDGRVSWPGHD